VLVAGRLACFFLLSLLLGDRLFLAGFGRRRWLLRRDGACRQQAGERYNGESVFQGKSYLERMSDSTPKPSGACATATRIYKFINIHA
jgi:hypothetical protein